jgi:hypothetical protein
MHTRFLKVKIKSLCAEARIIRFEELKTRDDLRNSLRRHRVEDVRSESRATLLAYNFLRGKTLAQTEPNASTPPDWDRVERMVKKYGNITALSELETWRGGKEGAKVQAA